MKKRIPIGDFKITRQERTAINRVLDSGRISEGERTREFERSFARYLGIKHCVAVNSGTSALLLGLQCLMNEPAFKVRKGNKVIVTPLTFAATVNAIVLAGLEPVFVDVDPHTFGILPEAIEGHLRRAPDIENYRLMVPVHLMGYPCDMRAINRIAARFGLLTFEDSAQAHGSAVRGKKCGTLSLLSAFSFYIAHNIQAGEMGALVTSDDRINDLARSIRSHGRPCVCTLCTRMQGTCPRSSTTEEDIDPRFTHTHIGYNFKVMEFQPALALLQMGTIGSIIGKRSRNVAYLNKGLRRFNRILRLPRCGSGVSSFGYPLVIARPDIISRKVLRRELESAGIETRPLFGCVPTQQPAYAYLAPEYTGRLPNAEYLGRQGFYIGCHQYLTRRDLDYIIAAFGRILNGKRELLCKV